MVPDLHSPDRHDLYLHKSSPIPQHTCLHHLQEPHNHIDRIRRGAVVWRQQGDRIGIAELWIDGTEQRYCSVGRYPACSHFLRRRQYERGGGGEDLDTERWVLLDVAELHLLCFVSAGDAEENKAYQLQGSG